MQPHELLLGTITSVILSIMVMWTALTAMLKLRNISFFLPFLFIGVVYCFEGSFVFFQIFDQDIIWTAMEFSMAVFLVWLLINLGRVDGF